MLITSTNTTYQTKVTKLPSETEPSKAELWVVDWVETLQKAKELNISVRRAIVNISTKKRLTGEKNLLRWKKTFATLIYIYLLAQILIVTRKIMIMMNGRGIDGDGNENDEAWSL